MSKPAEPRLCSTREYARLRGISRQRVLAHYTEARTVGRIVECYERFLEEREG